MTSEHRRIHMSLSSRAPESGFEPRIGRSVSIDHAARLLGVSRRTIYNRIGDGRLQTVRTLGGSQRVTLESMAELGGRLAERPFDSGGQTDNTGVSHNTDR